MMCDGFTRGEKAVHVFVALLVAVAFAVIGFAVAAVITNESNRISEGVVIDKNYSSAYTTYSHIKSGNVLVNVPQFHPERYRIQLEGEKDGETVTYWRSVTEQEYSDYEIGDYYPDKGEWP